MSNPNPKRQGPAIMQAQYTAMGNRCGNPTAAFCLGPVSTRPAGIQCATCQAALASLAGFK